MLAEVAERANGVQVRVDTLRIRPVPFLPADTPMYDLLRLFKTGRSHMVCNMSFVVAENIC